MENITYTVTKNDLIAWSTYTNMKIIKDGGRPWYIGRKGKVLGIVLFLAGIFSALIVNAPVSRFALLLMGVFLFLMSMRSSTKPSYLTPFLNSTLNKQEAKFFENADPGLIGQMILKIEEDGLIEKTAVSEQKISWEGVGPVISHENYVFIFINTVMAAIINRNQIIRGNIDQFKEKVERKALVKG